MDRTILDPPGEELPLFDAEWDPLERRQLQHLHLSRSQEFLLPRPQRRHRFRLTAVLAMLPGGAALEVFQVPKTIP